MKIIYYLLSCLALSLAEDYYEALDIPKDATSKEIRKAFKKLALQVHPDKNPGDPEAHANFVRLTSIYEVLKDEETRKKYDKYGEDGLKDGGGPSGRYESYNYYQNEFGIYDDDPEVVTLDGSDFDAAMNSGEVWFVNFYSPRCGHCHDLAPTWRDFAEKLSGVVNIGAVNCFDNRWTCNRNGIRSYPSLFLFKRGQRGIKYNGERTTEALTNFILQHIKVEIVNLDDNNADFEAANRDDKPWFVFYNGKESECFEDDDGDLLMGDCSSTKERRKLAGLTKDIGTVGHVDCAQSTELCDRMQIPDVGGVYYYPTGEFGSSQETTKAHRFASKNPREIYEEFMKELMEGIRTFSTDKLASYAVSRPILAFFHFNTPDVDENDTAFKKLPTMLEPYGITVAKVQCGDTTWCTDNFYVTEDSTAIHTLMFNGKGLHHYEVFHGRMKPSELSSFAQESRSGNVLTLNPTNFKDFFLEEEKRDQTWFVDFFAPWCPPCRALLPELRKASNLVPGVKFGTLDCVMFSELCGDFNIRSYPTTKLFNGTIVSEYMGNHDAYGMKEFVEDLIDPPYVSFIGKEFETTVLQREVGITWVVDFYANWCGPCQQLIPEWKRMAKSLKAAETIRVGAVDCADPQNSKICRKQMVEAYPEIRLFPAKKTLSSKPLYKEYEGWNRQAASMTKWVMDNIESGVITIQRGDMYNGVPDDDDAWVIDFYAPWCGPCNQFYPNFVLASMKMNRKDVKFGKVDCDANQSVCSQAGVTAYPTVMFFPPVEPGSKKYRKKKVNSRDPSDIVQIVEELMQGFPPEEEEETKSQKDEL